MTALAFLVGCAVGATLGALAAALAAANRPRHEWCGWCGTTGHIWECCPDFVEADP